MKTKQSTASAPYDRTGFAHGSGITDNSETYRLFLDAYRSNNRTYLFLKRAIDLTLSSLGLIITLPFLPLIALFIKLDSRGPVFYHATRMGNNLKPFKMYKFRTMIDTPIEVGDSVSPKHDPRVTTFGRFLRRSKINEFPQLLNILKGEMTFVGPRPECPDMAARYPADALGVFSVTPGLVGPNQILGRNEEEMYPPGVDARKYYLENILPPKVKVDLEYISNPGILKDINYIFCGIKATVFGALNKKHLLTNCSQLYLFFADAMLITASLILGYAVGFQQMNPAAQPEQPGWLLLIALTVRLSAGIFWGLYGTLIRYISYHDIMMVVKSVTTGSMLLVFFGYLAGLNRKGMVIFVATDWLCLLLLLAGLRFGLRFYWEKKHGENGIKHKHRVLIYGAGRQGDMAYRLLTVDREDFDVVGFIDDAPDKYGKQLHGRKVLGNRHHIKALSRLYRVEEIILACGKRQAEVLHDALEICQQAGLGYRLFSKANKTRGARLQFPIKHVELSDMLPLKNIRAERGAARKILAGKTVLINGSGGEMGTELCSHFLWSDCAQLIVIDQYDSYLRHLVTKLRTIFPKEKIIPIIVGNNRKEILATTFEKYKPDIVVHASLKKYEQFFKTPAHDLAETNYEYTLDIATLAMRFNVAFFIMISSCVAADSTGDLSKSLRITELSLQKLFKHNFCRLIIPRLCDIVENYGGVVSLLESQIKQQRSVLLPAKNTGTTLLSKYSAAEFIMQCLVEAARTRYEDGVFVCETGPPITINTIAGKIAQLHGLSLERDLIVKYTGTATSYTGICPDAMTGLEPTSHHDVKFLKKNPTGMIMS